MMMMWPLAAEGKGLDISACMAELSGFVHEAAHAGLPAHQLERGLQRCLLRPGHALQARYFALTSDGDGDETLTLADGGGEAVAGAARAAVSIDLRGLCAGAGGIYGSRERQQLEVPLDAHVRGAVRA